LSRQQRWFIIISFTILLSYRSSIYTHFIVDWLIDRCIVIVSLLLCTTISSIIYRFIHPIIHSSYHSSIYGLDHLQGCSETTQVMFQGYLPCWYRCPPIFIISHPIDRNQRKLLECHIAHPINRNQRILLECHISHLIDCNQRIFLDYRRMATSQSSHSNVPSYARYRNCIEITDIFCVAIAHIWRQYFYSVFQTFEESSLTDIITPRGTVLYCRYCNIVTDIFLVTIAHMWRLYFTSKPFPCWPYLFHKLYMHHMTVHRYPSIYLCLSLSLPTVDDIMIFFPLFIVHYFLFKSNKYFIFLEVLTATNVGSTDHATGEWSLYCTYSTLY